MNEQLKNLLNCIGALTEFAKAWYDSFTAAGFDSQQSLYLTGEMMKESMHLGNKSNDE